MTSNHSPPFNLSETTAFPQVLKQVLLGISSENTDDFFKSFILHLTQALGVEYGFVSELKSENSLQVVVGHIKGNPSEYCLYQIDQTPCERVIKEGYFLCSENLRQEFPEDVWLQENHIESYIGKAIYDQKGKVIGVLCIMSIHALPHLELMAEILDIFVINASRELQKIQAEKKFEEINQNLEKLVQARTIQLKKTNNNLRQQIQKRQEIESQLIKQEHQFRDLVYNIDNGVLIVNREGKIKFANPAALEIFEQSLENLLDYDFGIPIVSHQAVEIEIIKSNHNRGLVEMKVTLTEWEQESVYLVSFQEITARKKAEEALIKATETKTHILSTVSHEIRIPISAILGFSEFLQLKLKSREPRLYGYAETIYNSSKAILDLINDLLNVNQLEAGKIVLNYNPFSLRDFTTEITNIFSYEASKKRINLLIDIKNNVPQFISFDSLRLRQILINLIGNSFKFIEKGHVKIIISVEDLNSQSCTLNIAVEDTGIGIKNEDKEQIFEAFAQSKGQDNRHYLGNGLGLSIVQKYTELLGGTINLESEWGKGSTFTLILPNVEIIDSMEPLEDITPQKTLDDLEPITILFIDNISVNCDLIEGYFLDTEHNLFVADEEQIIIDILESHPVDVILINLNFQKINKSLALLHHLKKQNIIKDTLVISMTNLPPEVTKNNQNLFQGFLENSLNYSMFVEVLSRVLLGREKQKNNGFFSLTPSDYQAITNISDLLETLEEIEDNSWKLMRSRMVISELKNFVRNLQQLGQTYNCNILIDYGNILANYLDTFDLEELSNTLEKFPHIRLSLLDAHNYSEKDRNS